MSCAQGHLKDRPGEEQPFWGDAARVALPGVEQASLSTVVIPRAKGLINTETFWGLKKWIYLHFTETGQRRRSMCVCAKIPALRDYKIS